MRPFTLLIVAFLVILCSCSSEQHDPNSVFDPSLLVGEWRVDSSSNGDNLYDILVITEDGFVYDISHSDGGSVRFYSKTTFDTIKTEYAERLAVHVIDSNRISVSGEYSKWTRFYKRCRDTTMLNEYLQADSLRTRIIGWWKVRPMNYPFELINSYKQCDSFTLNVRSNGEAIFFADNYLDSAFSYYYSVNSGGFTLNDRCVVAGFPVHFVNDSIMQVECRQILNLNGKDTLTLDRITQIQNH